VTDANLLLGYLSAESPLAAGVRLDRDAAERVVQALAGDLGLGVEDTARGIVRVADEEMLRALRVATVERGVDPRRYALVAFGGAGPMHAARLAEELEIATVLCPRAAGVLSAQGLAAADRRRDAARTVLMREEDVREGRAHAALGDLAREATAGLRGARTEATWDVRYAGQAFELPIPASPDTPVETLRERFERAHAERYGYADAQGALEIVNLRVTATVPRETPISAAAGPAEPRARRGERRALFGGQWLATAVLRGMPPAEERVCGPAVIELDEATVVVPPGWSADVDPHEAIVMRRDGLQ
jgi:N-methylhydantoinase A